MDFSCSGKNFSGKGRASNALPAFSSLQLMLLKQFVPRLQTDSGQRRRLTA
jgi:hypothetical protein